MKHIQQQLDRIRQAISRGHWREAELRGAEAALEYALDPEGAKSPMMLIVGRKDFDSPAPPPNSWLNNSNCQTQGINRLLEKPSR